MLKHQTIIDQLTIEEKASLLSGSNFWNSKAVKRLGIPSIMLTDGPHGLRKQGGNADAIGLNKSIPATCFPTAAALAHSWNPKLLYEVGEYIGREAVAQDVAVVLGPGLNIIRNPLGGRNFEYYSEDPYLAGELAVGMVKGIQSNGIAATPKHYAVNSQEQVRMSVDEIVDERSLREIYLEGFRRVVEEAKPKVIMSSYNKVNGQYASENTHLLKDILYGEWGFDGVVVTDWGANNDRVSGLKAGNQLEMPSTNGITDKEVVVAVASGNLAEKKVDQSVDSVLDLVLSTTEALKKKPHIDYTKHHQKAVEAARQSMVLLKNDDAVLPLKQEAKVAIIGDFAKIPRFQGAGSSLVNPTQLDGAYEALEQAKVRIVGYGEGYKRFGGKSKSRIQSSIRLAKEADVVLLFLGLNEAAEAEGFDRPHMRLPDNQLKLVDELAKIHQNIIVVLCGGAPAELPFIKNVKALLHSSLGGQGSGQAVSDILTGTYTPSGKLAVTYPLKYEDVPSAGYYPGLEATAEHREGIFVGYRYYDTKNVPVLFPFGHGLSYTSFSYADLKVENEVVSFTLTNTGKVAGEEIAQLYVKPLTKGVFKARRQLKGFTKVQLDPGETKQVEIQLDDKAFAYFNVEVDRWVIEAGEYEIEVGSSIDTIHLVHTLQVKGEKVSNPYSHTKFASYYAAEVTDVHDEEFTALINRELPPHLWNRTRKLTLEDTFVQLQYTNLFGKAVYGLLLLSRKVLLLFGKRNAANNIMFIMNMPFKKLSSFSGGKVSKRGLARFLKIINL